MAPVLEIENLSTHIKLTRSVVQAVGNVDLRVDAGETLGIVGESGCGKSMTGLSIMGLLPPGGSIVGGSVKLDGRELVGLKDEELRQVRGNEIAMIFQDPLTSLDPTKTIGYQVAEPVRLHKGASKSEARDRAVEVLNLVGLPRPKERLDDYPHQLSGGLRQRVMIAMALANEPKLLIADEPTTALDVTIQAQILALLRDLKDRLGMAMLLITHDMGVIAGHANRVNVMYAGRVVETAGGDAALQRDAPPLHPGAARLHPPARPGREKGAARHSRPPAGPVAPAGGLPVRRQVLSRYGQVPYRRAVPVREDVRAQVLLLAPGRRAAHPRRDRRGRAGRREHGPARPGHRRVWSRRPRATRSRLVADAPLADSRARRGGHASSQPADGGRPTVIAAASR